MIILYYINCSACSQNTVYSNDKSCSSLSVDDEKTQICIKNPSSFGCKQITSCEQATYVDSYEKCSRLSVNPSRINTHVCIKNPDKSKNNCIESNICTQIEYGATSEICSKMSVSKDNHACIKGQTKINAILCEKLLKKLYGLSEEENLIFLLGNKLVKHEEIKELNEQTLIFSTSLGAFLPIVNCINDKTVNSAGCQEYDLCQNSNKCQEIVVPKNNIDNNDKNNSCTQLEYGGNDEVCSKLSVSKDKMNTHVCILDSPKLNLILCEKTLKKKYGLSDKEELIILMNNGDYQIFSSSLGLFLPLTDCYNNMTIYAATQCKEENICTNVNYINSDSDCSKLTVSSENSNTHMCVKNPLKSSKNCIESNKCNDVKYGGTNDICSKLISSNGKICIKDQSSEGCKETDSCLEAKFVISNSQCSSLKISDSSYIKSCIKDPNGNGCIEQKFNCEEKTTGASDEICEKLLLNDNTKKCIKNKDGNNCMLINYCDYAIGESIEECGKYPVKKFGNICVKKKDENNCIEVKEAEKDKESDIEENKDLDESKAFDISTEKINSPKNSGYLLNISFILLYLLFIL